MTCRCCPALVAMREEANRLWPNRDKASDGCCGDEAHQNRVSDHNPDKDGFATAYDLDHDDTDGFDGFLWSERIRLRRDPRIKYVIFFGRMFSSYSSGSRKAWEWGPYTGPNAHKSHVHFSVLPQHKRVIAPWFFTDTQEDDLTPDQDRMLRDLHKVFIQNRVDRERDNVGANHDLATPILKTNGAMDWLQKAVERIAKKVGA